MQTRLSKLPISKFMELINDSKGIETIVSDLKNNEFMLGNGRIYTYYDTEVEGVKFEPMQSSSAFKLVVIESYNYIKENCFKH